MLRVESVQLVEFFWADLRSTISIPIFKINKQLSCLNWCKCNDSISSTSTTVKNKTDLCLLFFGTRYRGTGISEMFIGSGDRFFSFCAECVLWRRFSTTGKLTAAPSDISPSYSVGLSWQSPLHTVFFPLPLLQLHS